MSGMPTLSYKPPRADRHFDSGLPETDSGAPEPRDERMSGTLSYEETPAPVLETGVPHGFEHPIREASEIRSQDRAGQPDLEGAILFLRQLFSETLKIPEHQVLPDASLERLGVDSTMAMELTRRLEKDFGTLSKTLFFEYATIRELAGFFQDRLYERVGKSNTLSSVAAGKPESESRSARGGLYERVGKPNTLLSVAAGKPGSESRSARGGLYERVGKPNTLLSIAAGKPGSESRSARGGHPEKLGDLPSDSGPSPKKSPVLARPETTPSIPLPMAHLPKPSFETGQREPIAVIGLSGRYPGAADLDAFWANLCQGRDAITLVPEERWDWRKFYSPDKTQEGRHYSKWGGFIQDADKFDPLFFNISPLEAESMDPQERLFLEYAWMAMEDAGYCRPRPDRNREAQPRVGVYAGVMYGEYQVIANEKRERGNAMVPSGSHAGIANRVSFVLDLKGPSMTLDTMCSGSLTCLHLACLELESGRIDMALAGGVNLSLHPNKYLMLSQGGFISGQGRCESFGRGGDGYIPGEGVGVAVLKRLSHAIQDRDHIYGLILGSAVNHGGRTTGYSVPSPASQAGVVREAIARAGIDAGQISYIEAHGTGTSLGDPIEIEGLSRAFGQWTDRKQFCRIGSVKSNIGHCESAAGIAGITKVLLQMKHGRIAPSLHCETPNPHIDFENTPFAVNRGLTPWERSQGETGALPRVAGVSSFGAGGSNAHLVLSEYQEEKRWESAPSLENSPRIILLSARNRERLEAYAQRLLFFAREQAPETPGLLDRIARTLQTGREPMAHRLGISGPVPWRTAGDSGGLRPKGPGQGRGSGPCFLRQYQALSGDHDAALP